MNVFHPHSFIFIVTECDVFSWLCDVSLLHATVVFWLCFRLIYIQLWLLTFDYFGWNKYKLPVNIHGTSTTENTNLDFSVWIRAFYCFLNEKWSDRIVDDDILLTNWEEWFYCCLLWTYSESCITVDLSDWIGEEEVIKGFGFDQISKILRQKILLNDWSQIYPKRISM